jgi:hypothetical protein
MNVYAKIWQAPHAKKTRSGNAQFIVGFRFPPLVRNLYISEFSI